jgi:hypothetical protein
MTTDIFLQNRLIQTSQTGGQWYIDTSPFSIPCVENTALDSAAKKTRVLSTGEFLPMLTFARKTICLTEGAPQNATPGKALS